MKQHTHANLTFEETIQRIKKLEIQGAESVATMAARAFGLKWRETKNPGKLKQFADELIGTRPTEPALRNALNFCLNNLDDDEIIGKVLDHFEKSKDIIAEYGANKIENGMIVFTHCHSSTVMNIMMKARKDGKKFQVRNTETRPRFQGRITAKELSDLGVKVEHFIDSAGRIALRHADIFLFGCDAVTSDGQIINKIGTASLLQSADKYGVPSFSCTNSWKFDPKTLYGLSEEIEERDPSEVWENPPKGVKIHNPAFEAASPDMITGIITELGIHKPDALVNEIKHAYPWMLNKTAPT